MNLNTGDLVSITCSKKDAEIIGKYISKCVDGHVIEVNGVVQYFSFDDWEVEKCE